MPRKTMKKGIRSQKTLKNEKGALGGLDFSIAKQYKKILEKIEEINILIKKRKNKNDRETLVDLLAEKALLQSQLKAWDDAGRQTDKKRFSNISSGKMFSRRNEATTYGRHNFQELYLKRVAFLS